MNDLSDNEQTLIIKRLLAESENLLKEAGEFADKGNKEKVREYILMAGDKTKEAYNIAVDSLKVELELADT